MDLANSIYRIREYYGRHGLKATIRRAGLAVKRGLFFSRMVVFYWDLALQIPDPVDMPEGLRVDRLRNSTELSEQDLREITSFWNPTLACRNIQERFNKGASLWLIKSGTKVAGYGWTLQGRTVEPYFFPLGKDDVHLFDFHVFPRFRGQGINPHLVTHILRNLSTMGRGRAFIEAAEWNQAQLSSLRKTRFRCLGLAKQFMVLGHRFTRWIETEAAEQVLEARASRHEAPAMERPHGQ